MQQESRKNNQQQQKRRPGLAPILFLTAAVLTLLKLTGVIEWRWGWVLSPIWVPLFIILVMLIFEILRDFEEIVIEILKRR